MHRTPPKGARPPVESGRITRSKMKTDTSTATKSELPKSIEPITIPSNITDLIENLKETDALKPKKMVIDQAQAHLDTIIENLESSGNIRKTIKDAINHHAESLFFMVDSINCDMTEVAREILVAVMAMINKGSSDPQQCQEISNINEKMEKIEGFMSQLVKQNLEMQQEILDLRKEIKTIKEAEGKRELEVLEQLKNQNTASKQIQKDLCNLKEDIHIKPNEEVKQLGKLQKQNIELSRQTKQEIVEVKDDIKQIKQNQAKVSRPTIEPRLLEEIDKLQEFRNDIKEDIKQIKQKQIKTHTQTHTQPPAEIDKQPPKTYANIVVVEAPKTTHCLLVGTDQPIDTSEDVANKIKNTIKAKESGFQISKFRKVKDQRVLIGSENEADLNKIKTKLELNNFKVEIKNNKDPLIIIRNVNSSNTDDDIIEAIQKQNSNLIQHIPETEYRAKVRHRRKARNPMETHVVLQVSPMLWKALTTAGKIFVDLQRVPVFDLSPLVQCSRCLQFGHGKKWCTESTDICGHCTGPHMQEQCPSRQSGGAPTCKNCTQAKYEETSHNTFSIHCPVRKKWDALARSSVAYC